MATETTSSERCLADQLVDLHEQFQNEAVRAQWRADSTWQATEHFLDQLLGSDDKWAAFAENAMDAVRTSGKKTLSLMTWQGRGPSYRGQFLSELFDLGSLREKLQDVLDVRGGEGRFMVFKHSVPSVRGPRTFSLTVSWDTTGFANAQNIIQGEREKAQARLERSHQRRDGGDEEGEETEDRPQRRQYNEERPQRRQFTEERPVRRDTRPQYEGPRRYNNSNCISTDTPRRYNNGADSGPRRYNNGADSAPRRYNDDAPRDEPQRQARPSRPQGQRGGL